MSEGAGRFSKDVETRKVQRLGSSSLFITLPKKWINKWGVKPGDKIIIEISEDGGLRLVAEKVKNTYTKKSIKIDVDNYKQSIVNAIPSLYILGYDEMLFTTKKNLDPKEIENVITLSKNLVGIEVAENNNNLIRLDCLLDTEKLGLETLLRRILNIISKKVDEIIEYLRVQQSTEVQQTLEDLRRVYLMLLRRSIGNKYMAERDKVRNFIIAINSTIMMRVYRIISKLHDEIKHNQISLPQEQAKTLIDMFRETNDLFDEIIMSILFPSIKRISNGYTLINQLKQKYERLDIKDNLIRNYFEDLIFNLEEALNNSSCSIFLEDAPWIERNFNS
ncbi:AbrB family transcriptional regulator [Sulfolobus acidocaldarius SUSAZ]|nr:AbrB family transcriptional regulator [Sulfolobus acidocaldarius SUSAZ]